MPRLFLLRHAKARWAEPGQRDFDRTLDPAGVEDARRLGRFLRAQTMVPDKIAASTSRRTRQTVEALGALSQNGEVVHLDALYEATAVQTLEMIHSCAPAESLMIVGHNPVMEDLATVLVNGDAPALQGGFPTCGLAVIAFDGDLQTIEPESGRLELFWTPSSAN